MEKINNLLDFTFFNKDDKKDAATNTPQETNTNELTQNSTQVNNQETQNTSTLNIPVADDQKITNVESKANKNNQKKIKKYITQELKKIIISYKILNENNLSDRSRLKLGPYPKHLINKSIKQCKNDIYDNESKYLKNKKLINNQFRHQHVNNFLINLNTNDYLNLKQYFEYTKKALLLYFMIFNKITMYTSPDFTERVLNIIFTIEKVLNQDCFPYNGINFIGKLNSGKNAIAKMYSQNTINGMVTNTKENCSCMFKMIPQKRVAVVDEIYVNPNNVSLWKKALALDEDLIISDVEIVKQHGFKPPFIITTNEPFNKYVNSKFDDILLTVDFDKGITDCEMEAIMGEFPRTFQKYLINPISFYVFATILIHAKSKTKYGIEILDNIIDGKYDDLIKNLHIKSYVNPEKFNFANTFSAFEMNYNKHNPYSSESLQHYINTNNVWKSHIKKSRQSLSEN
ncbi:hypothetical protein CsNV_096 [Callinectes sapidus nudivirus]|nr:hypothetical protein CsNV_096 [Callinectes sapidus nudivirus]